MKTKFTSEQEYINAIAPDAIEACKRYGYLPSVLIAQSCLENGYGIPDYWDNPEIEKLLKYNNMVGMKAELLTSSWDNKSVWPGKAFSKNTPEEYDGRKVTIKDAFRIYDDAQQSFDDFLLFLKYASNYGKGGTPKYGDAVLSIKDPETLITTVSKKGYATDSSYAKSVMKIINKHKLTKYDSASSTPEKKDEGIKVSVKINTQYITTNNSNAENNPTSIVIHNTDNFDKGANALAHAKALYQGDIYGMSWHYAVDDSSTCTAYQCIPWNRGAWHVGKNYGRNNLFGVVNNRNSIGIEMCVQKGYNYEKAFQNTVKLTKWLMEELNIPAERVYQHYDICSKDCPSQIRARGDWGRFKSLIAEASVTPKKEKAAKLPAYKVINGLAKYITDTARTKGWSYGDSQSIKPCADKKISCDRLPALIMYLMGFTDQKNGGETCNTLGPLLEKHGWKKVTKKADIKPGSVIAVRKKGAKLIDHVFVCAGYSAKKDTCTKFDTGSNERIKAEQPFRNVKLVEWADREFVCAWNPPAWLGSASAGVYVYNGVDYGAVFNPTYYGNMNEDVKKAIGTDSKKLFEHFLKYGMAEGRRSFAGFNVKEYKKRYKDLQNAFDKDLKLYYKHYCEFGKDEGRVAVQK